MPEVRVLIVEDENIVAADLQERLRRLGYDVAGHASTGEDAVDMAKSLNPDLVLMDIMLRGRLDGVEAAARIFELLDVPVIYLTAYADPLTLDRAKVTSPYGYILKPFYERELHSTIEMALYRHRMEREVREQRKWLSTILDSIADAVVATDNSGRVAFMNPLAERLVARPCETALSMPVAEVFMVFEAETGLPLESPAAKALSEGREVAGSDSLLKDSTGRQIPVEFIATPIIGERRAVLGAVLVFRDITVRKRAEQELQSAMRACKSANQAKSEFLANISHEIRTPMNGIIGMTDLMLDTTLSTEQRELLTIVKQSADSLMTLLNSILDLSKVEAGKMELDRTWFEPAKLLEGCVQSLTPQSHAKGLALKFNVAPDVPSAVLGDAMRLRQVILNLLGNAIKFTESGGVNISVERPEQSVVPGRVELLFKVTDTGIGIADDKRSMIFESFSQADGSTTRRYGGTGLGLAISSQIITLMNGRMWVESEVGKGSTFYFTALLGRQEAAGKTESAAAPAVALWQETAPLSAMSGSHGRRLSILLAEDNVINQRVTERALAKHDHHVTTVSNGLDAIERLRGGSFDLLLLDVQMPVMDGFEVSRIIRSGKDPKLNPRIPIIALTAHAMAGDRERCLSAGMDGYISKPFRISALLDTVERAAAGSHTHPSHGAPPAGPGGSQAGALDLSEALEFFDGDREMLMAACDDYIAAMPAQLSEMRHALARGDAVSLRRQAHALKSASAHVGAFHVRDAVLRLEDSAAKADMGACAGLFLEFEEGARAALDALRLLKSKNSDII